MSDLKTISERVFKQCQSVHYQRTVADSRIFSRKCVLKVDIRVDALDDQSHARVLRWSGERWELLVTKPITACLCQGESYLSPVSAAKAFHKDAEALLDEAGEILKAAQ